MGVSVCDGGVDVILADDQIMFSIIGMTNRIDLIDDALLRPGRLEVQMEISALNPSSKHISNCSIIMFI